jgi:hypothetical protein
MNVARVLNVGTYARALGRAHALYLAAVDPTDMLQPLIDEGTALREVLLADANALVRRKLMNGERLKELAGPSGYKNLAFDLEILGAVFEAHYGKLEGKWGTDRGEIRRALEIAAAIAKVVGEREQTAARVAEAADMRARAFTLFLRAYDEARRAVTYLRWHKADVADITPSLYAKRGRRKNTGEAGPDVLTAPTSRDFGPTPVTDARIHGAPATPVRPAIGTPDADPFLS